MRRSLARGLSQFLGPSTTPDPPSARLPKQPKVRKANPGPSRTREPEVHAESGAARLLPLAAIRPNATQPRRHFEAGSLAELAASIQESGILQPVLVRPKAGTYELIAGERRYRAAAIAGLKEIPAIIRQEGERESLELALIENLQREDISPLEAARAFQRLLDEFKLTQEAVAKRVGKSRPAVANTLRLLRLPPRIQEGLQKGAISEGHARALLSVSDPAVQLALFERIVAKGLSVREVEEAVQAQGSERPAPNARRKPEDPHWEAIRTSLSERFGSPVKLQRKGEKGRLVIEFFSDDDLDRILESLEIRL
ncbi:MAG: ParB/RepB/Spo0J family partition protein [Armatimonadetes bacterium]|nr:ParB/RepB/Spo0J family partition protein [Armatimonadota bacterium]